MTAPNPIELAFEHLTGSGAASQRIVFLHGMLGRGNNLRTIARRFLEQRPTWDAWLVDLRGHGASPKSSPQPSLGAAAEDVLALCRQAPPIGALVGHSFGGKVALEMLRRRLQPPRSDVAPPLSALAHVVTLDSNPGVRRPEEVQGPDSALAVMARLRTLPQQHASRAAFVEAALATGLSRSLAQWLAQSTEATPQGTIRFALDLDELQALLLSYFTVDLWPLFEQPPPSVHLHCVIAGRSTSYSLEDRARMQVAAQNNPQVTCDVLATDHWVHAEDPDGVLKRLWAHIPA
jgi:pimeloyl-ACP methyl ester carboxylesterase